MNKKLLFFICFLGLFTTFSFAGNNDSIGVKGLWDRLEELLNDGYVRRIVFFMLLGIGFWRMVAGSILQFVLMVIFAILFLQIGTIIDTLSAGVF